MEKVPADATEEEDPTNTTMKGPMHLTRIQVFSGDNSDAMMSNTVNNLVTSCFGRANIDDWGALTFERQVVAQPTPDNNLRAHYARFKCSVMFQVLVMTGYRYEEYRK